MDIGENVDARFAAWLLGGREGATRDRVPYPQV